MGKLIKWLLGLVFVLVVLVVSAVIILPVVIDPNDYKDEIVNAVREETGRELEITRELNLSVFPWLGLETGGVTLSNAQGFGDRPFAKIDELGVRVKLMPLLSNRLEVDTLVLNGLDLNLMRNKQGLSNWDDLAGKGESRPRRDHHEAPHERGLVAFKVEGVQLQDARVSWVDRQAGQEYELKGVRLVTGALAPGASVPVKAGFELTSEAPRLQLSAKLQANIEANEAFDRYVIGDLMFDLDGEGEGLPEGGMQIAIGAQVDMDLAGERLEITGLKADGPELSLQGNLKVSQLNTKPQLNGGLELGQTNLKKLAALFGAQIETSDEQALTKVSADLKLMQSGDVLKIDPLNIKLDDSTLKGFVHVLNPEGPVLRAKMDIDSLNADRYMPPATDQQAQPVDEPGKGSADPFEPLRQLDLEAEAGIAELIVNKLKLQQVKLKVVNKKGVLTAKPMGANLYGGRFAGAAVIDASGKKPKIHAKNDLTEVNIGPLLEDLIGQDRLLGKGEVHLDLRTVGISEQEINRSLTGQASLKFSDGAYKGVNLAKLIRGAGGALGGGGQQAAGGQARTDFTSLSASATIKNGLITNKDLDAKSPLLRVSGKGTADLGKGNVDYAVTTELVASLQGQGGAAADKLTGVPIGVRIKGPFNDLSYTPDLEGILKAQAKKKLEGKKEEIKAKAAEKLQDKLKGQFKLPGLFR